MKNALLATVLAVLAVSAPLRAQQKTLAPPEFADWLPVTDAERQLKEPVVEKDPGAEVLLWRVHVVDEYEGVDLQRVLYNYIRIKVFNAKGKEKTGTVDLPYREPGGILDVAGRTIKADGSILLLDRKNVYQRDLVRANGLKEKVVSFAMPGVEEGSILEYRWKQTENDNRFRYLRLEFTRDLPVQQVTYFVRPLTSAYVGTDQMFLMPFNCKPSPLQPTRDNWTSTTVTNIPAAFDEPYAPSNPNTRPWALLYYRHGSNDPMKYWNDEAKRTYNEFKDAAKTDADQKAAAAEAVSQAKSDDEKIIGLIMYVRSHVRNFLDPEVTDAERQDFARKFDKRSGQRPASDILKSRIGTAGEMNIAFFALATQLGLDVKPALVANWTESVIDPQKIGERYFADSVEMAVRREDSWKFFNVSDKNLYPGMLPYIEEGMFAVVSDAKGAVILNTPTSSADGSLEIHSAKLQLSADGGLSGDVEVSYTGHRAEQVRRDFASRSESQRETWLRDRLTRAFPDSEIKSVKFENAGDPAKPLQITYHLDAPGYAQVTGKRMFFEPAVFHRGIASPFSASERRHPVLFPFSWKEVDQIHIKLPDGFELEAADSPGNLDLGGVGSYKILMTAGKGPDAELFASREFTFGKMGLLYFQSNSYPSLKHIFDEVAVRDTHKLSLRAR